MVLMGPNPTDGRYWLYQIGSLSTRFRLLLVDPPGYGRSPRALNGLTVGELAAATWRAIRPSVSEPATLVGVSVGANVVLHMERQDPTNTRALILSGFGLDPQRAFVDTRIAGYAEHGAGYRRTHFLDLLSGRFRETPLAQYLADVLAAEEPAVTPDGITALLAAQRDPDPPSLYRAVAAPVVIVSGTEDPAHERSRELAALLPDCRFVSVRGAGHACNLECPWAWDAAVNEFLVEVGLGAPTH